MKKYFIFSLVGVAMILLPKFSFAATYTVTSPGYLVIPYIAAHQDFSFTDSSGLFGNFAMYDNNGVLQELSLGGNTSCGIIQDGTTYHVYLNGCTFTGSPTSFHYIVFQEGGGSTPMSGSWTLDDGVSANAISFLFPLDGSGSSDFRNWVLSLGVNASDTYGTVSVHYGSSSSSLVYSDSASYDEFISADPFPISKSVMLNSIVSVGTSTWYAKACYGGTTFSSTCTLVISFGVNYFASTPSSSSTILAGVIGSGIINSSSSPLSTIPWASCSITDWGGCLYNSLLAVGEFFFQPTASVQNVLSQSTQSVEGVFPFNLVFGVIGQFQSAVSSTSVSSGELDLTGYPLDGNTSMNLTILSSSTLASLSGDRTSDLFDVEDFIMYALLVGACTLTVYHHFHKPSGAKDHI